MPYANERRGSSVTGGERSGKAGNRSGGGGVSVVESTRSSAEEEVVESTRSLAEEEVVESSGSEVELNNLRFWNTSVDCGTYKTYMS